MRASMDREVIEDTAVRWFAKRESGAWSEADQAEFDAWRAADRAHRIEYLRVEAAWKQAARMKALGAGVPAGTIPPRGAWGDTRFSKGATPEESAAVVTAMEPPASPPISVPPSNRLTQRNARVRRIAAGVVLALAVGAGWYSMKPPGERFSTPIGGIENVSMADGSKVTLNTDTSLRVVFDEKERRIQLEKGEAFFDVAKDAARPFAVYAGDKRVVAVGTKFSVRRHANDVQVVVTEGRVNLDRAQEAGAAKAAPPPASLRAGAIARTAKAEILVRENEVSEAEKLLSWRSGYVVFDDTALAEAVAEFNRYNLRQISIEDPALAELRIGGNFRANNADAFLWLLQNGFPIQVERREDRIVLKLR